MNATGRPDRKTSHTYGINANAFKQLCINCHSAEGTTVLTGENFQTVFLEEQAEVFDHALSLAVRILKSNYGITYDAATNPYFFEANGKAVTNWKRGRSTAEAKKLMGACYNIALLTKEPAAFAHGRTFVRRLLYDTIDYLDDGSINMSTGATALASNMKDSRNALIYVKGSSANDSATTAGFTYLAGYNRTSGAWNTPYERP
jgi:hypothetical protein